MHVSGSATGGGGGGRAPPRAAGGGPNRVGARSGRAPVVFGRTSASTDVPKAAPQPRNNRGGRLSEQRFDKHRSANPFAAKPGGSGGRGGGSTGFASAFSAGGLPARIDHSSGVRQKLQWSLPLPQLNYDPLLVQFFEGLTETKHPFVFVARTGITDLLSAEDAGVKAAPLLMQLIPLVRMALLSKEPGVFDATLEAIRLLAMAVGPALNPHLPQLLVQLTKYIHTGAPKTRELVQLVLETIEESGGPDALAAIKRKVPTWQGGF
eukprot:SAG22_NODE_10_length_35702_cov_72.266992_16_plen_265_part_00